MKSFLVSTIIFLSFHSLAQEPVYNSLTRDQGVIEPVEVKLKSSLAEAVSVQIMVKDGNYFMLVNGFGRGTESIKKGDKLIFLLDNWSTATAIATENQGIEKGKVNDSYSHLYSISKEEMETLARSAVIKLRKHTVNGLVEMDIPARHQDVLKEQVGLLLND